MITLIDNVVRVLSPLRWAKKHGMHVGEGVTLSSKNGTSFGSEPYLIYLDDYVRLSGGVTFITHDGGTYVFRDKAEYSDVVAFGSIHVGERTFIGYKAIILPGVKIGSRCVIGAGAVVTHDIPDNSIAVGVPARVISSTDVYAQKLSDRSRKTFDSTMIRSSKEEYLVKLASKGVI